MGKELAFVLINPYTIAKSRTGGVIARFIGRTDLDLVGARMFGPSMELVGKYSEQLRHAESNSDTCRLLADYVLNSYAPDPVTGRPRRVMMLLFEGDDAVEKIWKTTGSSTLRTGSGETVRDTYGDYILDEQDRVKYFEPAVLVGPTKKRTAMTLHLWSRYSETDGGVIDSAMDVSRGDDVERTLVLLKPDNFRIPSFKAGNIIDLLSASGLRIVAVKKFRMTVAQAEEFYGPVRESLKEKFGDIGLERAADALAKEFGFEVPKDAVKMLCEQLGPVFAESQFESIIQFMTGYRPSECMKSEKKSLGREDCLALGYEGADAVGKIRAIIGLTDPIKARPGSVRREFGKDIMVNAAHASDSAENAAREMNIIDLGRDHIETMVNSHYGGILSRATGWSSKWPSSRHEIVRKLRLAWGRAE